MAVQGSTLLYVFCCEDHFADFADGAIATLFSKLNNARNGFYLGNGIGWASGYACVLQEIKVVHIIAHKADFF